MNPLDPDDARTIVIAYAELVERDVRDNRHPARLDSLPFPKAVIKSAICTSARCLASSGCLTADLSGYLETAYSLLAEYLDPEVVDLMTGYREAAERLGAAGMPARDRLASDEWRTVAGTGALAGEVARTVTAEAEALRAEFRSLLASP